MEGASKKRKIEKGLFSPINSLPPDCVSHIISLVSPRDACMFSLTSSGFRSVMDSDDIWQHFLPSDIASILSRAVDPVLFSSKKDLFIKLCEHNVLINGGKLSFGLDRSSGKKCYMISARALDIDFGDKPHDSWRWISLPDSRFVDVVQKMEMCSLDIVGKINSEALSPETRYAAYLVYKMNEISSDLIHPLYASDKIKLLTLVFTNRHSSESFDYLRTSQEWMEAEIGEFYIENGEDGEVEMILIGIGAAYWRKGLIIEGIEIRPKH